MERRADILTNDPETLVRGEVLEASLRTLREAAERAGFDTKSAPVQVALIEAGTLTHLGIVAEVLTDRLLTELRRWRTGVR